ncbi:MAG: hypothetical protein QM811_09995 [Pirellulales bacterium]
MPVDIAGAFPEAFYSTTNQRTEVRLAGEWRPVADQEMDCGIVIDRSGAVRCVPMTDVAVGDAIVCGHVGVRVFPEERKVEKQSFEFMNSAVSTEKPKGVAIRQIAQQLFEVKRSGGRSLLVGGPAIIHTGSSCYVGELIEKGYLQLLFAGNALATHDIEQSLFGTSLGVYLDKGDLAEAGHEHHLRDQSHPTCRRNPPGGGAGNFEVGHHVRMRQARRRLRPVRQHPRRRSVARRHHRLVGRPARDARKSARFDVLLDDRHDVAFDRRRQFAAGLGQGRLCRH